MGRSASDCDAGRGRERQPRGGSRGPGRFRSLVRVGRAPAAWAAAVSTVRGRGSTRRAPPDGIVRVDRRCRGAAALPAPVGSSDVARARVRSRTSSVLLPRPCTEPDRRPGRIGESRMARIDVTPLHPGRARAESITRWRACGVRCRVAEHRAASWLPPTAGGCSGRRRRCRGPLTSAGAVPVQLRPVCASRRTPAQPDEAGRASPRTSGGHAAAARLKRSRRPYAPGRCVSGPCRVPLPIPTAEYGCSLRPSSRCLSCIRLAEPPGDVGSTPRTTAGSEPVISARRPQ